MPRCCCPNGTCRKRPAAPTTAEQTESYRAAWRACLAALPPSAGALLLRDYHKDNLLWLPERPGVRACGLLDFQDAQRGHPSYDLVSLIEDARRDVAPAVQAACLERYLAATGLDAKDFRTGFALMAAQRHARIIGLFVRLLRRDGKPEYLPHLPRVWRMFERALQHPALEPLRLLGRPASAAAAAAHRGGVIRHGDDPGGRPRRAHAAADRRHAQAADPGRRPLDARPRDGAARRARRAQRRGQRPSSRRADRARISTAARASCARTGCSRPAAA